MEDVGLTYNIHSTTHVQCPVTDKISTGACGCVLLAAKYGAIPLSHKLGTRLASPTIISTVGEWAFYGFSVLHSKFERDRHSNISEGRLNIDTAFLFPFFNC